MSKPGRLIERSLFRARVVGPDLRPLCRVEQPLEERPEDRRLDVAPVEGGHVDEPANLVGAELDDLGVSEQPTIEVEHLVGPEVAARAHRLEQGPHPLGQDGRLVLGRLEDAREDLVL